MPVRIIGFLVVLGLLSPHFIFCDDIDCGFYNEIEITDPAGDQTGGAPGDVDILSLQIRQVGDKVQFEWKTNGMYFDDSADVDCLIYFDTDRDPTTGAGGHGGIGAELKIWIWPIIDHVYLTYFDESGDVISDQTYSEVTFLDDGFVLTLESSHIPSDHFDIDFNASGGDPPGADNGSIHEIQLLPTLAPMSLAVRSNNLVNSENPVLINIPEKGGTADITVSLEQGSSRTDVTQDVEFTVYHEFPTITDPESLISIDENGLAQYNSEGYVFATARHDECSIETNPFVIATGDLYGDPATDQVIAVWPGNYQPSGQDSTYDELMGAYPRYVEMMNVAYLMNSDLYRGYRPYDGGIQIMAVLEVDSWCHASNPFLSPPPCYFYPNGSPAYATMIHEMGHNFQDTYAMGQLMSSQGGKIGGGGFAECSASLPVIYLASEFLQNGDDYGFETGSFERNYFEDFVDSDRQGWDTFDEFERQIEGGEITGIFDDTGDFDGVSMFCCFFQAHMYGHGGYSTQHGHELIRRFLNVFGDEEIPGFQPEKVDTYFVAAFSAAAGKDVREEFRFWGFDIDDELYGQIMPMIESRLDLFRDGFEFGSLNKWSSVRQ